MPPALPRSSSCESGFFFDETELRAAVENQVLGQARKVEGGQARRAQCFNDEVAVRNRIETVGARSIEVHRSRQREAINRIRSPRQRAAAQGALVGAPIGIAQSGRIAVKHLKVRQAPMCEQDWLGPLEVRVAGKNRFTLALPQLHQGPLNFADFRETGSNLFTHPQPQVGRNLIVAAAACLQLLAQRTDLGDQARFHP